MYPEVRRTPCNLHKEEIMRGVHCVTLQTQRFVSIQKFCGNGTAFSQDMQDCLFDHSVEENCIFILWMCFGLSQFLWLLGGSTVATCKVWCKWVKLLRRSLKKCVFNLWQFCKRFVQHIMWAVLAKNGFVLIIAPPAGHFYCVSYRGQSILFYYFDLR